jgi:hypothetical protein
VQFEAWTEPDTTTDGTSGTARSREWLRRAWLRRLTFELTPTAEAGGVSPVRENSTSAADRAYAACRSGSAVERGVRPHRSMRDMVKHGMTAPPPTT